jgi:hypothetical protein
MGPLLDRPITPKAPRSRKIGTEIVSNGKQVDEYVSRQFGGTQVPENQHLAPTSLNLSLGPLEQGAVNGLSNGTRIGGFTVEWL